MLEILFASDTCFFVKLLRQMKHQMRSKAYLATLQVSYKLLANYQYMKKKMINMRAETQTTGKKIRLTSDRRCPSYMLCHCTKFQET